MIEKDKNISEMVRNYIFMKYYSPFLPAFFVPSKACSVASFADLAACLAPK